MTPHPGKFCDPNGDGLWHPTGKDAPGKMSLDACAAACSGDECNVRTPAAVRAARHRSA